MATPPLPSPELGNGDDERRRLLFSKYGDLTGGGLVAPTIAQAGDLMWRMATSQSIAAETGRNSVTEYVTKREHALQMSQMDERVRQLGEELRRREQAHEELARLVQQLLARGVASPANEISHSMGYSRARPLAGQHGYPLAEHPINAMQPLQPMGGLGSNPGGAGPEVDPSQSTGAAGLPLVPMLSLPLMHDPLHADGAYDDGGFFGGGGPSEDGGSTEQDERDIMALAGLGPLGDEGVLGSEVAMDADDVEQPERTVGEAGTCQLTEAEGFVAVLHLEMQYVAPVVIAVPLPDADADAGTGTDAPFVTPPVVAVVERTATSFTLARLSPAGATTNKPGASLLVGYVVVEQGLHRQLVESDPLGSAATRQPRRLGVALLALVGTLHAGTVSAPPGNPTRR